MFAKLAKENGMDDEDLDDALDDGYWNDDGENAYNVFVTHSSWHPLNDVIGYAYENWNAWWTWTLRWLWFWVW